MKYENLKQCTEICERIAILTSKLNAITPDIQVVIIANNWDASFPIIKEWVTTQQDENNEQGLFSDILTECKLDIIARIKERIDFLEHQLEQL